jgi:hypothetical protein
VQTVDGSILLETTFGRLDDQRKGGELGRNGSAPSRGAALRTNQFQDLADKTPGEYR